MVTREKLALKLIKSNTKCHYSLVLDISSYVVPGIQVIIIQMNTELLEKPWASGPMHGGTGTTEGRKKLEDVLGSSIIVKPGNSFLGRFAHVVSVRDGTLVAYVRAVFIIVVVPLT